MNLARRSRQLGSTMAVLLLVGVSADLPAAQAISPPMVDPAMVPPDALNNDLRRLMTRTYTAFKTGL